GEEDLVLLRTVEIEGFKTFRDREKIDLCPGWDHGGSDKGTDAPPFTCVFGGNGAGKSAVVDAVLFVLGQSAKSLRSNTARELINDQSVRLLGSRASATVTLTFQKVGAPIRTDTKSGQGKITSRVAMMETLTSFVGVDMSDVDAYVLKQGSTMVCRRGGKELLSFLERLAGTSTLKDEIEESERLLVERRLSVLRLEESVEETVRGRKKLQPQARWGKTLPERQVEFAIVTVLFFHCSRLLVKYDKVDAAVSEVRTDAGQLKEQLGTAKSKKRVVTRTRKLLKDGEAEIEALSDHAGRVRAHLGGLNSRIKTLEKVTTRHAVSRRLICHQQLSDNLAQVLAALEGHGKQATGRTAGIEDRKPNRDQGGRTAQRDHPDTSRGPHGLSSIVAEIVTANPGVHGMLDDLLVAKESRFETALAAAMGGGGSKTVVVQTRSDGLKVVDEVRKAGVVGQVRCDILEELQPSRRGTSARSSQGLLGGGLSQLADCVSIPDPVYLPLVYKHLDKWLLADTREVAWDVQINGSPTFSSNVVSIEGELFFSGGEVAVRRQRHHSEHGKSAPGRRQPGCGQGCRPPAQHELVSSNPRGAGGQMGTGAQRGAVAQLEEQVKEARRLLCEAEARVTCLEQERSQAGFHLEDAKLVESGATTQVIEVDHHGKLAEPQSCGLKAGDDFRLSIDGDRVHLPSCHSRREALLGELKGLEENLDSGDKYEQGSPNEDEESVARELSVSQAEAEDNLLKLEEVEARLRVAKKRITSRQQKLEILEMEGVALRSQSEELKARERGITTSSPPKGRLIPVTTSHVRQRRQTELREAGTAAREIRRDMEALRSKRSELESTHESLLTKRNKLIHESEKLLRELQENAKMQPSQGTAESKISDAHGAGAGSDNGHPYPKRDTEADKLSRAGTTACEGDDKSSTPSTSNHPGEKGDGGISSDGLGKLGSEGREHDQHGTYILDETAITEMMSLITRDADAFKQGTIYVNRSSLSRAMEASVRLKEAALDRYRKSYDPVAVEEAFSVLSCRLDEDTTKLTEELDVAVQDMCKSRVWKEELELRRHSLLVSCLEDVNRALGKTYRQLTISGTVGQIGQMGGTQEIGGDSQQQWSTTSAPFLDGGGDCYLSYSQDRSLLLTEGVSVLAKPDRRSVWREPGQLSGGQSALVGLALNLATQAVRPAPLYLMDEVR
ncbi:unnamed protein product, partial [Discosporangium mesarthrocarpum]